ncbi:hypothetical protein TUM18999_61300 [Pseudomonas tohonis]|uniref:TniQ domain-containing protein n=2 Tax=Pseudomonas tohonis TaxID=2725477 RepID=A0A6J4EF08_9PSED|nr:hypothetical protein TUM18999_61300 [Pseudomonas tohonis]GJN52551.1 hypothetical protein TUM20286_23030 [Pseudomonas tohonis]
MQLKLLPDEALDSFLSRNFVYAQRWRDTSINKWYAFGGVGHWTVSKISNLADMLGVAGRGGDCYLYHYHTNYYRAIFAQEDLSWGYPPERFSASAVRLVAAQKNVKLCPACLQSDYEKNGFIYWRRSHQGFDIAVCAQHNIKLVSACGGCHKPYLIYRHFFETPWTTCECGFSVLDLKPEANNDLAEWKLSKFVIDLFSYKYQLKQDQLAGLIKRRLFALGLVDQENIKLKFQHSMNDVHYDVFSWNCLQIIEFGKFKVWGLPYVLAAIFDDFNDFANTVVKDDVERCHIYRQFFRYCANYINFIAAGPIYHADETIPPSRSKTLLS